MPAVPVFDMKRSKWDFMPTTFTPDVHAPDWPYPQLRLINYAAHVVGERLYVFGCNHRDSIVGTDLLMELHIPTRRWRRLSGSEVPHPSSSGPGPRMQCHRWAAMIPKQTHEPSKRPPILWKQTGKTFLFGGTKTRCTQLHGLATAASGFTGWVFRGG
ncbi:hypothetical protein B0H16DRAFT_1899017 [Mycena metata]|uniref:Uncharacterized protein n=1 Tax=Mycena metata TaxID=1033252 RepID=A0AAD7H8L3_9AGAR|nr:hypothetical protein B0H16DRAFT_1899017 [Mycena metata]